MQRRIPKYSKHKATGQARVRIDGRTIYLGKYDSPDSHRKYDALIARWLSGEKPASPDAMTVSRLCVKYIEEHAKLYYRKNGRETSELSVIQAALKPLVKLYGRSKVVDFGPGKLKRVRQTMIDRGLVRASINQNINRIRRLFKWGVENELVPVNVHVALTAVAGLLHGRSEAIESEPIEPVPEADIKAVMPFLGRHVGAMIQLQLLTGMRPGEVRMLRLADVDMTTTLWEYRPAEHKTQHHGHKRVVMLGPKAQAILSPFLTADREQFLFSPAVAEAERRAARRESRKSPLTPSQQARRLKSTPKRTAGDFYSKDSYARCIKRACKSAGVPVWTPNRLRHNAATRLRKEYDIETVRTILGHATGFTTEIYAELDHDKARQVAAIAG